MMIIISIEETEKRKTAAFSFKFSEFFKFSDILFVFNFQQRVAKPRHYHLEIQVNPKKMAQKNRCYF